MNPHAIIVTIKLKPGMGDAFRPFIMENGETAVRDEPGCQQFHIMTAEGDPDTYFFYEVYDSADALDTHREQPHFKKFRDGTKDMIAERSVQSCTVLKT
ncbi:MAG: antibiotic biosynthesis monooxygenase [Rhodospirillales bacterium]|nr:antibiotic biosynthesis monooxygenase [Rhodospirillales bacterium]